MSDLDTDLYGGKTRENFVCTENINLTIILDLYGNDEVEAEIPLEDVSAPLEEVPPAMEVAAVKQPTPEAPSKPPAMVQESTRMNGIPPSLANGAALASVPSYMSQPPAPQKIPTYEQPQPNDYRESVPIRQDGGYQSIAVNERSIRPSEMKDEG